VNATAELITLVKGALSPWEATSRDDVDVLAERYLAAEKAAAEAFRIAESMDSPHQRIKDELILMTDFHGLPAGDHTKLLRGSTYEVRVTHFLSEVLDHDAVTKFGNHLRRKGVRGLFEMVFQGSMHWQFRPDAGEFLKQVRLPHELQNLYDRCRRVDRTPTLEVHSIPRRDVPTPRRDDWE
jgi:hypothetical protein